MKQKLFSILTLLLCAVSGAWAEDITVTWLPDNMSSITKAGTASIADVLTVSDLTTSEDLTDPELKTFNNSGNTTWGNFIPTTLVGTNKNYSKDDYITFAVTVNTGYTFYPTSVTAFAVGSGTGNNAAQLFSAVQSSNGSANIANSSSAGSPTQLSMNTFSTPSVSEGNTLNFYIHVGSNATESGGSPIKGISIRSVVLTGTYEVAGTTKLSTPSISISPVTGVVTIDNIDANATKVTYTTDGTDPTASSTTYNAPFTVNENCTIKAIAICDGASYSNSNIASQAANITVENPVITAHNGTVSISCATDGATIKYSTDNETWETYSQPFTLSEGKTVYAKAVSENHKNNSATVSSTIDAAPAAASGSQSKILHWIDPANNNNWEYMDGDNGSGGTNHYGIRGKADTEEDGWSLWISPNSNGYYDKGLSNATYTSIIDETEYSFMKNSNGRQFNIGIPSNIRANRITIYSYNAAADQKTIWSNVGGTTYTTDTEVSIVSSSNDSPEVRVFTLNDVADNIILNNAGYQQCFMVVVDYTTYVPGPNDAEYVTEESEVTEIVTFTKSSNTTNNSVSPNNVTGVITIGSPSYKDSSLEGYSGALELSSNTTITIALPVGATNASVTLTDEASNDKKLKVDGTDDTSRTWTGDATNGYSTTISIPDNKAGSNFVIAKKDTGTKIVKITLTYTANLPTGGITLTTTANMAGWRAFYDAEKSYTVDENTKIYTVTSQDEKSVKLTEVTGRIPTQTPVLLKTSDANHTMTLTAATTGDEINISGNLLQATNGSTVSNVYRLGYGANGVGFYQYSATSPASGIVYLPANTGGAKALLLSFGDVTAIDAVAADETVNTGNGKMYNLSGQLVGEGYKGIVIVNGKKVIK